MQLDFFNVDQFCEDLPEIKTSKIYAKNGFHQEGLFSEQIFGPVKTATTGGVYWGRSRIGETDQTTGIDITFASERRKRFAKIVLPFPILNPVMYHLIIKAGKIKFKEIVENLIFNDKVYGYYYNEDESRYIKVDAIVKEIESEEEQIPETPEGIDVYKGLTGLYQLVQHECQIKKDTNKIWEYVHANIDKFYMNNVIVLPPEFRPVSKTKDAQMRDKLNEFLITILNYSLLMKDDHLESSKIDGIGTIAIRNLQRHVFNLYNYVFDKLSKKTGLIRGSILGKRVDFSGRAVISPDPSLKIDECSIPYVMALELYKMDIANILLEKRMEKRYDSALTRIDDCIKVSDFSLFDIVSNCCNGKNVILNRQPTLHRMGILSFKAKVNKDWVIKIHPMVCEPYNADFDGDQMAIYRSISDVSEKETQEKLSIKSNLICPTTGSLVVGANQDIILGLYLLTSPGKTNKVKSDDGLDTYKGRLIFNQCLPDDYPFINKTIDKKLLRVILDDISKTLPPDQVCKILDSIKDLGFKFTTMYGCTLSLHNIRIDNAKELVSTILDDPDKDWSEKFSELQSPQLTNEVKKDFPYSSFVESGSRGSWDQVNQIILTRGYVSSFDGSIITTPIKSNLIDGLSREEFFYSCYGSRKGLLDTALNTGDSGYLTRKLVYCSVNLELDNTLSDCGCKETFNIMIPKEEDSGNIDSFKLAKSLIGRYNVNGTDENGRQKLELITYENYHTYVGTMVHLRSPIFCKSPNICKTCYGDITKHLHSQYVGIIAAQAMGEVSTQLVLRTFHTSGAAKKSDTGGNQDIVNDLAFVKKIFHSTNKMSYDEAVLKLFSIYSRYKNVLLVHYECIISQMMRCGKTRWRLTPERNICEYELVNIESIPARESWLLGFAFSKPKHYLIDGIMDNSTTSSGILENIIMNQKGSN